MITRNPVIASRWSGLRGRRLAERNSPGPLFQEPPRVTRRPSLVRLSEQPVPGHHSLGRIPSRSIPRRCPAASSRPRLFGLITPDWRGDRLPIIQSADGRTGRVVAVGEVGVTRVDVVAPVVTGGGTGAGGVFPFRFVGKRKRLPLPGFQVSHSEKAFALSQVRFTTVECPGSRGVLDRSRCRDRA